MDYDRIMKNLKDFLKTRGDLNFPLTVSTISLNRYIKIIKYNFKSLPVKLRNASLENIPDDTSIIQKKLREILKPIDKIFKIDIFGWAERKLTDPNKLDFKKYSCRNIGRIKTEAFIAPDGTWYACCFDSNNELVLGNVNKELIGQIFKSEKRKRLIEMLEKKEFGKIGGPCRTVNCCQHLFESKSEEIKNRIKKLNRRIIGKVKSTLK
jgi:radical SAM protein with 4Fe4S-binding SPASM domain